MAGVVIVSLWNAEPLILLQYNHTKGTCLLTDLPLQLETAETTESKTYPVSSIMSLFPLNIWQQLFPNSSETDPSYNTIMQCITQQLLSCQCVQQDSKESSRMNRHYFLRPTSYQSAAVLNSHMFFTKEGTKLPTAPSCTLWWFPVSLLKQTGFLPLHPRLGNAKKLAKKCEQHLQESVQSTITAQLPQPLPVVQFLKRVQREMVWFALDVTGQVPYPRPPNGRIPHFLGCQGAADRLAQCREFAHATVVKVNPSLSQRPVRFLCMKMGKVLLMPSPSLEASSYLMYELKDVPPQKWSYASTKKGAMRVGKGTMRPTSSTEQHVDLIVVGSLAVCPVTGIRLGKGEGWADLEWALLHQLGLVDDNTVVATTVHDLQVVHGMSPHFLQPHDVPVDLIVTPTRTIRIPHSNASGRRRNNSIFKDLLTEAKLDAAPLLRQFLVKPEATVDLEIVSPS